MTTSACRLASALWRPALDPGLPKHRGVNEPVQPGKPPELVRMGHVVFFCPKGQNEKASNFYLNRLGFRLTDRAMDLGDFLRAPGSQWHHNLFASQARRRRPAGTTSLSTLPI